MGGWAKWKGTMSLMEGFSFWSQKCCCWKQCWAQIIMWSYSPQIITQNPCIHIHFRFEKGREKFFITNMYQALSKILLNWVSWACWGEKKNTCGKKCLSNQVLHLIITYACQVLRKQSCEFCFLKCMRGYNCELIKCPKKHGFAGMCFVIIVPYYNSFSVQCGIRGR